jgi:hypothetical protein
MLRGAAAREQRARLRLEGVQFSGKRVDMERYAHLLKPWEIELMAKFEGVQTRSNDLQF